MCTLHKRNRCTSKRAKGIKLHSARGQAMTEYIILVVCVALVVTFMLTALPEALQKYVRPFFFVISRPFP